MGAREIEDAANCQQKRIQNAKKCQKELDIKDRTCLHECSK
jgi:hypothetical protein